MKDKFDFEPNVDPHLIKKIETLRPTPDRDPEEVEHRRQMFLTELDLVSETQSKPILPWLLGWIKPGKNHKDDREELDMNPRTQKLTFATAAVLLTILFVFFGGAGATALAANSALPGDTLYPIKTGIEDTRAKLTAGSYDQAQLYLSFAQRRLDEMSALVQEGRFNDIELASSEFEAYVEKAMAAMNTVMAADPEKGAELSSQITEALLTYASILKDVQTNVPENIQPAVEQAIMSSQTGAGEEVEFTGVVEAMSDTSWTVDGKAVAILDFTEIDGTINVSDTVKIEAIQGSDGALTAKEIELVEADTEDTEDEIGNDEQTDDTDTGDEIEENEQEDDETDVEDEIGENESEDQEDESEDVIGSDTGEDEHEDEDRITNGSQDDGSSDEDHEDTESIENDDHHDDDGDSTGGSSSGEHDDSHEDDHDGENGGFDD